MSAATFEPGLRLIEQGRCPLGCVHPMACWTCPVGHATECHHPHTCEEARCGHLQQETTEEEFDDLDADLDGEGCCPSCGAGPDEECQVDCDCDECEGIAALDELEAQALLNAEGRARILYLRGRLLEMDYEHAEEQRQLRIWAGKEHACRVCGCSESRACSGGCIWAEPDLCSRCARATSAMARDWSGGAV